MVKVKIYTTSSCPYCQMAKDFLTQHKIEFEEINVEQDREAAIEMVRKSGQYGVPVLDIENNIVIGFDESRIRQLLKL